jgi:hypothetical protein
MTGLKGSTVGTSWGGHSKEIRRRGEGGRRVVIIGEYFFLPATPLG